MHRVLGFQQGTMQTIRYGVIDRDEDSSIAEALLTMTITAALTMPYTFWQQLKKRSTLAALSVQGMVLLPRNIMSSQSEVR